MNESLQLQSVHLRVADLDRSIAFYSRQLGLHLAHRDDQNATFAAAESTPVLLQITEDRAAKLPPRDAAGLFHAALLLPTRGALGNWLHQAVDAGVKFDGFSDHGVSEALYLTDPDGNGLEFYTDRPREMWPFSNGELQMVTEPLALPDLLAAGASHKDSPLGQARWGHLHLRVSSLELSQSFYAEALGVSLMQHFGDNARFLATDGYHHHLGINRWGGVSQPQPPQCLGLINAVFARRGASREIALQDPDRISVRITPQ